MIVSNMKVNDAVDRNTTEDWINLEYTSLR